MKSSNHWTGAVAVMTSVAASVTVLTVGTTTASAATASVPSDAREYDAAALHGGDVLCIPAGTRGPLKIKNLHGDPGNPVVVTNCGGQAVLTGSANPVLNVVASSHFKLTGSGSADQYGIRVVGTRAPGQNGVSLSGGATDYEVERLEVSEVGFAGIMSKTEPSCDGTGTRTSGFVQRNTHIHHNYVHDTDTGEGFYIGHTSWNGHDVSCDGNAANGNETVLYPHAIEGLRVHDNLTDRTAAEGIQVASADGAEVHHNTIRSSGLSPFEAVYQQNGLQIGTGPAGGGLTQVHGNRIEDSVTHGIIATPSQDIRIHNNVILRPGRSPKADGMTNINGMFIDTRPNTATGVQIEVYHNTVVAPKHQGVAVNDAYGRSPRYRVVNNIIVDPGAFDAYESDNTWRTGANSAYVRRSGTNLPVDLGVGYDTVHATTDLVGRNVFTRSIDAVRFVSPATGDHRLQPTSPAVDAGVVVPGVTTDIAGATRPAGAAYDIGAYEHVPTATPPAPAPTPTDTTAPGTRLVRTPKATVVTVAKRVRVTYRFAATEAGARFECRLDGRRWRSCSSPKSWRVTKGRHVVRVRAVDAAGNTDATPARHRFRVLRRRG